MPTEENGWKVPAEAKEAIGELKSQYQPDAQAPLTFGEKLVGLTFNPSNDDKVGKAKRLCADLADLVNNEYRNKEAGSSLDPILYNHTIGEILNAQMNAVKLLTLKY